MRFITQRAICGASFRSVMSGIQKPAYEAGKFVGVRFGGPLHLIMQRLTKLR